MRLIIQLRLPLTFVNNPILRGALCESKYGTLDYKTLKKALSRVSDALEKKIADLLPKRFAIMFDGWSEGSSSTHYVAVVAVCPPEKDSDPAIVRRQYLLGFSPVLDESNLTAESHLDFIKYDLSLQPDI